MMKALIKYSLVVIGFMFMGCTDVIDVEVPVAPPRLVIEASLDWEKGTLGNDQTIKLSTSTPYFDNENTSNSVIGATVSVKNNDTDESFDFVDQNNGNYTSDNFIPRLNHAYTLYVSYNGENYIANENFIPVVPIDEVFQTEDQGFDKESLEVNVLFTDPAGIENFYLMKFFHQQGNILPVLFDISDEFTDGNQMSIFYEDEFVAGDIVDIDLYGISGQYYNYIRLLIEQLSEGGPFATIPAQLKGNCINPANPDEFAFGYFRLAEVDRASYTFE